MRRRGEANKHEPTQPAGFSPFNRFVLQLFARCFYFLCQNGNFGSPADPQRDPRFPRSTRLSWQGENPARRTSRTAGCPVTAAMSAGGQSSGASSGVMCVRPESRARPSSAKANRRGVPPGSLPCSPPLSTPPHPQMVAISSRGARRRRRPLPLRPCVTDSSVRE